MSESVKVLFRAERTKGGEVTAVFPTLPGTNDPSSFTIYARVGQHGSGFPRWLQTTRPAKPSEYRDLARELRRIGYRLRIGARMTRHDYAARVKAIARE